MIPAITAMAMSMSVAKIGDKPLVLLRSLVIVLIFVFAPPLTIFVFDFTFPLFVYKLCFEFRNIHETKKMRGRA